MGTWLKRIGLGALALVVLCTVVVFAVDAHVRSSAGPRIVSVDEAAALGDVDCVLVFGCGVHPDGRPSDMLADRVACGVALYENGTSPKLLMSGDHGRADYDEVNVMRNAAVQAGLPVDDVFMDHAGFSTYESMYRARDVFGAKRIVVVSQGLLHSDRAAAPDVSGRSHIAFRQRCGHRGVGKNGSGLSAVKRKRCHSVLCGAQVCLLRQILHKAYAVVAEDDFALLLGGV